MTCQVIRWAVLTIAGATSALAEGTGGSVHGLLAPETSLEQQVRMAGGDLCMPLGLFVLVRKGNQYGAIRFTDAAPGKKPGTGRSHYESLYWEGQAGPLPTATAKRRSGELSEVAPVGLHPWAIDPSHAKLRVGPFAFRYFYPSGIYMFPYGKAGRDYGFEFAPTAISDPAHLDPSNPKLRWFKYDINGGPTLSIGDLVGD